MPIQLMLGDLAIQGITVDAKNFCSFGLISTRLDERVLNELFLKFAQGFIEIDSPLDHFRYEGFQLLFHILFP